MARIEPPEIDGFRTSHNFDVTNNRLHVSWYAGGVTIHDVTDPAAPEEEGHYAAEGSSFWTAVSERAFTVASDIGGGLVVLHADRGKKRPQASTVAGDRTIPGWARRTAEPSVLDSRAGSRSIHAPADAVGDNHNGGPIARDVGEA